MSAIYNWTNLTLLSVTSKHFDAISNKKVVDYIKDHRPYDKQYGFHTAKSTVNILTFIIISATLENKYISWVISKFFDKSRTIRIDNKR